ncbi:MAG: hypothetical protein AAB383_05740 [Patescibacteria group bacterium]
MSRSLNKSSPEAGPYKIFTQFQHEGKTPDETSDEEAMPGMDHSMMGH